MEPVNLLSFRYTFLKLVQFDKSGMGPVNWLYCSHARDNWAIDDNTFMLSDKLFLWSQRFLIPDPPKDLGKGPVRLLYESWRSCRFGKESKISGKYPKIFASLA